MENNKLKEAMEEVKIYENPLEGVPKTYYKGIDEKPKTLQNKVFEALGEVSMCWSETPKGVFDSTNAQRIGNELMDRINDEIDVYQTLLAVAIEKSKDNTKPSLKEAIEVLCNALREDTSEGSYYHSWQSNIAMAFYDCIRKDIVRHEMALEWSNEAAKNFLNLLISK